MVLMLLLIDIVAYSRMDSKKELHSVKLLADVWNEPGCGDVDGMLEPGISPLSIGDGFIFCGRDCALVVSAFFRYVVAVHRRLEGLDDEATFQVRFALHVGDCWILADNVLGHPVNEVSRLAGCARSGQILASRAFWNRLWHYRDIHDSGFSVELKSIYFDTYRVQFKHDKWEYQGNRPQILNAPDQDRVAHNVLIATPGIGQGFVGTCATPDNAIEYTAYNNYHSQHQFSYPGFVRSPDDELFRLYSSATNERLMCAVYRNHAVRLPYHIEFAARRGRSLILSERDRINGPPPSADRRLVQLDEEYRGRCGLPACDELTEELYGVTEFACAPIRQGVFVCLMGCKCEPGFVLARNLSPDWAPQPDESNAVFTLRQRIDAQGCLPWNTAHIHPVAARVCVAIETSCGHILGKAHQTPLRGGAIGPVAVSYVRFAEIQQAPMELSRVLGREYSRLDLAALRALRDECGIALEDVHECILLGGARNLRHLGAPDLFYVIRIAQSLEQLQRDSRASTEYVPIVLPADASISSFDRAAAVLASTEYGTECRALMFFLMAYELGDAGPGPLGTGGQTWYPKREAAPLVVPRF